MSRTKSSEPPTLESELVRPSAVQRLATGYSLPVGVVVLALLVGCTACNARRSSGGLRGAAADSANQEPLSDTGDVSVAPGDVIAGHQPEDAEPGDVSPTDAGADDGAVDVPSTEDVTDADTTNDVESVADAAPDAPTDVSADAQLDVVEYEPWVATPCGAGTRLVYESTPAPPVEESSPTSFRSLVALDLNGDGIDEALGASNRALYALSPDAPPTRLTNLPTSWLGVASAGTMVDSETGEAYATLFNDGELYHAHWVDDEFRLDELPIPSGGSGSYATYVGDRLFVQGRERISALTLRDGHLEAAPCVSGTSGGLQYDAAGDRIWAWQRPEFDSNRFVSVDPDDCGQVDFVSDLFEGYVSVPPAVAYHDDGRVAIVYVDSDGVTQLQDGVVSTWDHGIGPLCDLGRFFAPVSVREAGADHDVILLRCSALDPFRQQTLAPGVSTPAVRLSDGAYLAGSTSGLIWRGPNAMDHPLPVWLPVDQANTANWWRRRGQPARIFTAHHGFTLQFPAGAVLQRLISAAGAAPPYWFVREHPSREPSSVGSLSGLRRGLVSTNIEGDTYIYGFSAWQTRADSALSEEHVAPDSDRPLAFGSVWAPGILNGSLRSAIYHGELNWARSPRMRDDLPTGLFWALPGLSVVEAGRGQPVLDELRVVRDAVDPERWFVVGISDQGLELLELDVDLREASQVPIVEHPSISSLSFVEPVGSLSTGLFVLGDGDRLAFMQVRDGASALINVVELPAEYGGLPPGSLEDFPVNWANSPYGGTLVDHDGAVWAVNTDATIERLEGIPLAGSASRGDFDGDGRLDVLTQIPNGIEHSSLFLGRCREP